MVTNSQRFDLISRAFWSELQNLQSLPSKEKSGCRCRYVVAALTRHRIVAFQPFHVQIEPWESLSLWFMAGDGSAHRECSHSFSHACIHYFPYSSHRCFWVSAFYRALDTHWWMEKKKKVISAFKVPNVYLKKTGNKEQTKPMYILINVMVCWKSAIQVKGKMPWQKIKGETIFIEILGNIQTESFRN